MEYINVVDENNHITGEIIEKQQAHEEKKFHRAVILCIINSKNEILLQKRAKTWKHPMMWDISASGHVQTGESTLDAAKRELKEEIGIQLSDDNDFKMIGIVKRDISTNREFEYIYLLHLDKLESEYTFLDQEVSEIKYVPYSILKERIRNKDKEIHILDEAFDKIFDYLEHKIKVLPANIVHKEFIIHANCEINQTNQTLQTNHLKETIDEDLFCDFPKFHCLIAEKDNKPVGMILYSYFYWANDGEVLWISQMFIEKDARKEGVFFRLIQELRKQNPHIEIVSCATGEENKRMQKILSYYGAKQIDLKFYYKKI